MIARYIEEQLFAGRRRSDANWNDSPAGNLRIVLFSIVTELRVSIIFKASHYDISRRLFLHRV